MILALPIQEDGNSWWFFSTNVGIFLSCTKKDGTLTQSRCKKEIIATTKNYNNLKFSEKAFFFVDFT